MRLRSVAVVTYPTVEPVSLTEAKSQVRLLPDQTDDDQFLVGLISAARRLVERRLGVALAQTQLRATYDNEEPPVDWRLAASFMPSLSIMSTQYRSALGLVEPVFQLPGTPLLVDGSHPLTVAVDGVTVDPSTYVVDTDSAPGTVRFSAMPSVPAAGKLTITYWAGPGVNQPIAPQLRAAILLYVGHLYVHREAVTAESVNELPMAFETLLASESVSGVY
jgi:hypothetical protein